MLATADQMVDLIKAMFMGAGSAEGEALAIGRNLVEANLAGHDSHGIGMVPRYIENARKGGLTPNAHVNVVSDNGTIVQIDGNMGYGQVTGAESMAIGLDKARDGGVGIVALRNTHHLGRIGAWGEICAAAGFISIHYVNAFGHMPLVVPFGGTDPCYTTNPYCTAIPATDENPPIILDMATSKVAMGKIRVAYNKGVEAPEDALIGPNGMATRDPGVMFREPRGALLPFGEHKGYGLALICEVLAGALTNGGAYMPEREARDTIVNNMLTVILDPAAIGDAAVFAREIDGITARVKASPPEPGVDAVMVAGDPERKSRAEREADGIPIDATTWEQIIDAADSVGLSATAVAKLAPGVPAIA
ncbi:MAG: malate/lactate/ureidoglycolate dehydrogenase [Alphaproteobacteria bacterium]|jgi:uncharacterized oxidoreductase|nr:malate/lactate/ureidoglycolate dehydrogenase [Alphaproteobacteria bacterium]